MELSVIREIAKAAQATRIEALTRKLEEYEAEGREYHLLEELRDISFLGLSKPRTDELLLEAARRRMPQISLTWLATVSRDYHAGQYGVDRAGMMNGVVFLRRAIVGFGRGNRKQMAEDALYDELTKDFLESGETRLRVLPPREDVFLAHISAPDVPPRKFKVVDSEGHLERLSVEDAWKILAVHGAGVTMSEAERDKAAWEIPLQKNGDGSPIRGLKFVDPWGVVEVRALELGHVTLAKLPGVEQ